MRLAQALAGLAGPAQVSLLGRCDLAAVVSRLGQADVAVACGGDGTASAVAAALAAQGEAAPALGVVPLGTGNDLARVLGWSGAAGDLGGLLAALRGAERRQFDRWRVEGPDLRRSWCNYLSLGVDARIAQRFHHLRLRHPRLVRGALVNRSLYGVLGVQQRGMALSHLVRGVGGPPLPPWAGVLVVGNIPSYAGGVVLARGMRWDDGQVEMVALGSGLALGLATARLRRPRLLRRLDHLEFDLGATVAMQVDGEPFSASPGHYRVVRDRSIRVLVAAGAPCAT